MSSWNPSQYSSIFAHITLSDISQTRTTGPNESPVLEVTSEARSKGYDSVCLPLTTDAWKKRWTNMCLVPSSPGDDKKKRESRRESKLMSRDFTAEKKAEAWREKPVFEANEVTMTRLGEFTCIAALDFYNNRLDEAEGVTAIISEWLELDTDDDWIRLDTEIVSQTRLGLFSDDDVSLRQALQQELSYASYLNIQTAILPAPRNRQYTACYARVVNACLQSSPFMNLAIRLPIYDPSPTQDPLSPASPSSGRPLLPSPKVQRTSSLSSSLPSTPRLVVSQSSQNTSHPKTLEEQIDASWEIWDLIRSLCDYNPRLSLGQQYKNIIDLG